MALSSNKTKKTISSTKADVFRCPKRHIFKQHRRRNSKLQYFCKECNLFYTKDPIKPRINSNPKYYDKFLEEYFKLKILKPNVSVKKLCEDKSFKISRASAYRHLFTPTGSKEIDLLSYIRVWIFTNWGDKYLASVVSRQLKIEYTKKKTSLRIRFDAKFEEDNLKLIVFPDKSLFYHWPNLEYQDINSRNSIEYDCADVGKIPEIMDELRICIAGYLKKSL